MIRAEQIPDEVEAAIREYFRDRKTIREALAAALNAWAGAELDPYPAMPHLILPLPQEPRDE